MTVGLLTLELFLPQAQSLKAKRSLLRPLLEDIRREWNVSAAEVEHQDTWQRATLAVATVNTAEPDAHRTLDAIARGAADRDGIQVLDVAILML